MWFKKPTTRVLLAGSLLLSACENNHTLKETKKLHDYPSASGIEFIDKKFYIIGDDANNLVILDSNLATIDSIELYHFPEKRIPKALKPDLEAMALTADKKLLLLGSGSLDPYRNKAWLLDPSTKQKDSIDLGVFYKRLRQQGVAELNIEGACVIPGSIILANRGNKGYPKNHLFVVDEDFWTRQPDVPIGVVHLGGNTDSNSFKGVSGISYCKRSDRVLLTISTEDTRNALEDGAIGKSYLWIIENISSKKRWKAINPDKIIDLDDVDPIFNGQKIESVCITKETRNFLHLVLAADNDDGTSSIFRLIVEKK